MTLRKSYLIYSITILMIAPLSSPIFSQSTYSQVTLDRCLILARQNYPLISQFGLIEKSKEITLENTANMLIPQIILSGQATYQSDVTGLPIQLPNFEVPTVAKDQYRIFAEFNQSLTDFYTIRNQKSLISQQAEVDQNKLEVEFYKLQERILDLYFGVLLLDAQILQVNILKKDIEAGKEKVASAVKNGIALLGAEDQLQAEWLKAEQKMIELSYSKTALLRVLSTLTQVKLDENTNFVIPESLPVSVGINRPELKLIQSQQIALDVQSRVIDQRTLPRFNVFAQFGAGRPGLNMLSNDFDPYWIGGLRLQWNLSSFYTINKEKQILRVNREILSTQQEALMLNIYTQMTHQEEELEKLKQLMVRDQSIINLRENILTTGKVQLEQGVITSVEYVNFVHAVDLARQNLALNEMKLAKTAFQMKHISGYQVNPQSN
ncbi:MAG: TolC family protein [Saprospiraceae bacterium]